MRLFNAIQREVGGSWDIGTSTWGECKGPDGGDDFAFFDFGAQRLSQPLPGTPDDVAKRVLAAIDKQGYTVRVQHDRTLAPPRAVIGYPGGYLQGTEPDGFGFQFTIGDNYADFDMTGHCVAGDSYFLNTGERL